MPSVKSVALASVVLLMAVAETNALSGPAVHGMRRHSPIQKRRLYHEPRQAGVVPQDEESSTSVALPTSSAATSSNVQPAAQSTTSSRNIISDLLPGGSSTVSSTTEALSTTSSVAATSSAAPTSSSAVNLNTLTTSSEVPSFSSAAQGTSTLNVQVTVTQSAAATTSATIEEKKTNGTTFGRNSIIAIAVIASCIGAAVGIWTLIRKWKLSPSRKFNNRMQPIEWTPEGDNSAAGAGVVPVRPPAEKDVYATFNESQTEKGFRRTSGSSHTGSDGGRNVTGNQSLVPDAPPVPEHDFTAGPAHYGANGGYVDLQRGDGYNNHGYDYGATQGANLNRAPTLSRSEHEDPYAQDAYGGYDAYSQGHQQQAHQQHYAPNAYGDAYGHNAYGYQTRGQSGY